jgi:hypothetical protein
VITDPLFYLAAVPAVVLLGLAKGGFAGVGMAAAPLLALVVPPVQALGILLPILLVGDALAVWTYRRKWDRWNFKVLMIGQFIGVGFGWALAAHVSDAQVRLVVGLISVLFALYQWFWRPTAVRRPTTAGGIFWGAGAGFTTFIAHAGAPPFQMHMLPQRLDKEVYAATNVMFFAAGNVLKVGPYFALGQLSAENLTTAAVLMPIVVVATFVGVWLVRRISGEWFYRLAYLIVFVIGLELMRSGLVGMLTP